MKYEVAKSDWEFRRRITDQQKGVHMPPLEKPYSNDALLIDLVAHEDISCGKAEVYKTIILRRSHRKFNDISLSLEELSYLLLSTQGIVNQNNSFFRTVPSAGARHGLESYIYIRNTDGLEKGLYRYLPLEHKLLWIKTQPYGDLVTALAGQDFNPAVVFIWTLIPYRIAWRYIGAEEKLALLDVGHVCQNLYIACEAQGMGTCAIGAYNQQAIDSFLGVDGQNEFCLYASPVGKV